MNILVVDDEKEIADVVELYLQNDQYKVFKFYNGQDALDCINNMKIDLAILDIMLPDIDGFQILKQIRQKYTFPVIMLTAKTEYMDKITGLTLGADDYIPKPFNPLELVARVKAQLRRYTQYNEGTKEEGDVLDFGGLLLNRTSHECVYNEVPLTLTPIEKQIRQKYTFPVIMLTAKTEYMDKITGLTLGADDYIPKPFNPLELVARVKAQLRRYTQYNEGTKEEGDVLDFGGLLLNRTSHECVYNEVPLTLTPIEFDILWLLCENRGKVISSEELFEKVWHEKYYKNSNNTVMVHIRHLREKMSAPTGKSDFIKTVWGVGYKVEE